MKFFGGSSARRLLGFALILLLVSANAFVSYRSVRSVTANNQRVLKTTQILTEMQAILATMQDAETDQRGYIITGKENYLEPYYKALDKIVEHQRSLRDLVEEPDIARQLPLLDEQIEQRLASLKATIVLRRARGLDAAQARISEGDGKRKMDDIRRTVQELQVRERALLKQHEAESRQSVALGQLAFAVALGLNLLFLCGFYLLGQREEARRELAAAQLKTSNDRFRSIVSAASNILWTTNAAGEFVEEQPSWEAFTGHNRETYQGFGWARAMHPDDRERILQVWDEARAQQKLYSIEYRTLRHDGQWRMMAVRATPMRDARGAIAEWVGTSTDITEIQRTQRALLRSDQQMQLVLSNAPMILFTVDCEGIFTFSRGKALEALGSSKTKSSGARSTRFMLRFPT